MSPFPQELWRHHHNQRLFHHHPQQLGCHHPHPPHHPEVRFFTSPHLWNEKDIHLPHPLKMLSSSGFNKSTKPKRTRTMPLVWWFQACWQNFHPMSAWKLNLKYTSFFIINRSRHFKMTAVNNKRQLFHLLVLGVLYIIVLAFVFFYIGLSNKSFKIDCVPYLFVRDFKEQQ